MTYLISQCAAPFEDRAALHAARRFAAALMSSAIIFMLIVALPLIMQSMRR
ncbi:MAG: hypothetical protein IH861_08690 [Chloroflexi bacterium]|nr:hypothetical protein [Chloroflexota bacterium]